MFSIMALKIGPEGDKILRKNCLSERLASFFLEILSPLSPILSQNWKHDLARACFILKSSVLNLNTGQVNGFSKKVCQEWQVCDLSREIGVRQHLEMK